MHRWMAHVSVGVLLLAACLTQVVMGAEPKVILSHKTKDLAITLLSESGQWTQGKNSFELAFTLVSANQPVDVGKVTLNTSMPMPGMPAMIAGATLSPDKTPGRYYGTISFPDSGARRVTITWDGPGSKGSARFSVPVR